MRKESLFYLELVTFLVIPVILFALYPELFALRQAITVLGTLYCLTRLYSSRNPIKALGFQKANFWPALHSLITPSLFMVVTAFLIFAFTPSEFLRLIAGSDPLRSRTLLERLLVYFFISTPLQELIFRGYLTWRLEQVFSSTHSIQTISIIIFTLAHIPFFSPLILLLTFIMGYVYIRNYLRYRNLYALILSHSVVGSGIIMLYFLQSYI